MKPHEDIRDRKRGKGLSRRESGVRNVDITYPVVENLDSKNLDNLPTFWFYLILKSIRRLAKLVL